MKTYSFILFLGLWVTAISAQRVIYVADNGKETNPGTLERPLKSLEGALERAKAFKNSDVVIQFRKGTYAFNTTVVINAKDFKHRSLAIRSFENDKVVFSGGSELDLDWKLFKGGVYKASVDLRESPDQLFLNGEALPMARYPDYDKNARVFKGTAADALDAAKVAKWANPVGGYVHALHAGEWGGFHYQIKGKKGNDLDMIGGWQNNRPSKLHVKYRFVENIFEELDAPNEWFYNSAEKTLYFYPPKDLDLKHAKFTVSSLTDFIHLLGTASKPLMNITVTGIDFTQSARTFMQTKEQLLRSDWTIYRGGAVLMDGTENIQITNCNFYELGGNAIFVSNYNKNNIIRGNHIYNIGASAISFVGNADAVRSPAFRYEEYVPWEQMDFIKGPKTNNYPQNCMAIDNLIHHIGRTEKQVAGAQISISAHITVSHNTIYNVPRAGINISEGTFGGHLIEFNDVFDTVLETGDHGAFNSWGRDRFWSPSRARIDSIVAAKPGVQYLDVISPITLKNNRFQCDYGWDIDLDDGSSNYLIYNNVCLSGGLKLREGYKRVVTNNILINNTFHPHVWLNGSDDVFTSNIVSTPYAPIQIKDWGKQVDFNFFLTEEGLENAQQLGIDKHSAFGDAQFLAADEGIYTLKATSPAINLGFKNFAMNFGVTSTRLKNLAPKPTIRPLKASKTDDGSSTFDWLGATFKNIENLGERSAAGLHDYNGVLLQSIPEKSLAAQNSLQKGDVIIFWDKDKVNSTSDLQRLVQKNQFTQTVTLKLVRNQQEKIIEVNLK